MQIKEHVPLAPLTTFGIGGPARYFTEVTTEAEAGEAVRFARARGLWVFVLGAGSNILVSDNGFAGLVIANRIRGITVSDEGVVRAGAGEAWDRVVAHAVEKRLAGVECISGVPGLAGGAPVQNVGCYGQSADAVIREVRAVSLQTGAIESLTNAQCEFRYRDSFFRRNPGRYLITEVSLGLIPGGPPTTAYHDVARRLARNPSPTLRDVRDAIIEIRARKGMVLLPGWESFKSGGSFFKNPVVSEDALSGVAARVRNAPSGACAPPWFWEMRDRSIKIAAPCLLECAGFPRGHMDGNVGISPKHALSIINRGGATAAEVVAFATRIRDAVKDAFGIPLAPEVECVGFDADPFGS